MMTQAFYTGISGLVSSQSAIDATADNLANISSVGYRGYTTEFASLFEDNLNAVGDSSSISDTIGVGSRLQATTMMQSSGSYQNTTRSTDLAIYGDGWFGVENENTTLYTRGGDFIFDVNNDLVTTEGYYVLGTLGNNIQDNVLTSKIDSLPLGDIDAQEQLNFPKTLTYPPEPTTTVEFYGNIGTEDTSVSYGSGVVDANGDKNNLKLLFTKSETQPTSGTQWDIVATITTLDGETTYDTQNATVTFNEAGALTSTTLTSMDNNGSTVTVDLGEGYVGLVSNGSTSVAGSSVADGTIGGDLQGYEINENAEVIATFTNGEQSSVGKIALYHFQNDQGLERIDGTNFKQSSNSGKAFFFENESGESILGADVKNFKLESSNVSMEVGMTELIIMQRTYDANSKSITTADEMIQKALNMSA